MPMSPRRGRRMAARTRAVKAASSVYCSDVALKVNEMEPSEFKLTKAKRAVSFSVETTSSVDSSARHAHTATSRTIDKMVHFISAAKWNGTFNDSAPPASTSRKWPEETTLLQLIIKSHQQGLWHGLNRNLTKRVRRFWDSWPGNMHGLH